MQSAGTRGQVSKKKVFSAQNVIGGLFPLDVLAHIDDLVQRRGRVGRQMGLRAAEDAVQHLRRQRETIERHAFYSETALAGAASQHDRPCFLPERACGGRVARPFGDFEQVRFRENRLERLFPFIYF